MLFCLCLQEKVILIYGFDERNAFLISSLSPVGHKMPQNIVISAQPMGRKKHGGRKKKKT
jgi:hypothetical protein